MFGKTRATTSPTLTPAETRRDAAVSTSSWSRAYVKSNLPETEIARRDGNSPAIRVSNPVSVWFSISQRERERERERLVLCASITEYREIDIFLTIWQKGNSSEYTRKYTYITYIYIYIYIYSEYIYRREFESSRYYFGEVSHVSWSWRLDLW